MNNNKGAQMKRGKMSSDDANRETRPRVEYRLPGAFCWEPVINCRNGGCQRPNLKRIIRDWRTDINQRTNLKKRKINAAIAHSHQRTGSGILDSRAEDIMDATDGGMIDGMNDRIGGDSVDGIGRMSESSTDDSWGRDVSMSDREARSQSPLEDSCDGYPVATAQSLSQFEVPRDHSSPQRDQGMLKQNQQSLRRDEKTPKQDQTRPLTFENSAEETNRPKRDENSPKRNQTRPQRFENSGRETSSPKRDKNSPKRDQTRLQRFENSAKESSPKRDKNRDKNSPGKQQNTPSRDRKSPKRKENRLCAAQDTPNSPKTDQNTANRDHKSQKGKENRFDIAQGTVNRPGETNSPKEDQENRDRNQNTLNRHENKCEMTEDNKTQQNDNKQLQNTAQTNQNVVKPLQDTVFGLSLLSAAHSTSHSIPEDLTPSPSLFTLATAQNSPHSSLQTPSLSSLAKSCDVPLSSLTTAENSLKTGKNDGETPQNTAFSLSSLAAAQESTDGSQHTAFGLSALATAQHSNIPSLSLATANPNANTLFSLSTTNTAPSLASLATANTQTNAPTHTQQTDETLSLSTASQLQISVPKLRIPNATQQTAPTSSQQCVTLPLTLPNTTAGPSLSSLAQAHLNASTIDLSTALKTQSSSQPLNAAPLSQTPLSIPPLSQTVLNVPPLGQTPPQNTPLGQTAISIPPLCQTPPQANTGFSVPPLGQTPPLNIPPLGQTPLSIPPLNQTPPLNIPPLGQTPLIIPPLNQTPPQANTSFSIPPLSQTPLNIPPLGQTAPLNTLLGQMALNQTSQTNTGFSIPPLSQTLQQTPSNFTIPPLGQTGLTNTNTQMQAEAYPTNEAMETDEELIMDCLIGDGTEEIDLKSALVVQERVTKQEESEAPPPPVIEGPQTFSHYAAMLKPTPSPFGQVVADTCALASVHKRPTECKIYVPFSVFAFDTPSPDEEVQRAMNDPRNPSRYKLIMQERQSRLSRA